MNKKFTSDLYSKLSTKFLLGKELFISKSKRIHGNRYDYSKVEYNGNKIKVIVICPSHNREFLITPNHHMRGKKCIDCAKEDSAFKIISKSKANFLNKATQIHGNNYTYLSEYQHCFKKIDILCNKCGDIFKQTPADHLQGQGCPYHKKSKGEDFIVNYLKRNNIIFKREYKFENCVGHHKPLRFDFYLPDYNIVIEFDGSQHDNNKSFIPNGHTIPTSEFNLRKVYDEIKDKYCLEHNIKIIRIPYKEYKNIEIILNSEINKSKNGNIKEICYEQRIA